MIESCGTKTDKDEGPAQVMEYLGREINLVQMVVSIVQDKARAERILLQQHYEGTLLKGKDLNMSLARNCAGVYPWWGEMLGSARLHASIWWRYAEKRNSLSHKERAELMASAK